AVETLRRGATLGRYTVLGQLGRGAMGIVYSAHDPELDRKVALKLIRPEASDQLGLEKGRARLMREAQAMARLAHPNVVAVYDVGTLHDQVFVAMEYVAGDTLTGWLKRKVRSWREVVDLFRQAGRGLAAAHAAGLGHRDFKPGNVLVDRTRPAHVVDFGLARAAERPQEAAAPSVAVLTETEVESTSSVLAAPLTRSGTIMGTPAYMAPEQLLARPTDRRTDQFSFCVALYEALYDQRPFGGDTIARLIAEVVHGKVKAPPPSSRVPSWIHRVLLRGLQPRQENRYASMDALLADLERDPARARRRRSLLAGVVVAALAAGFGTALFLSQRKGTVAAREARPTLAVLPFRQIGT